MKIATNGKNNLIEPRSLFQRNYIGDFENLSDLDMTNPFDLQGCECSLSGGCGDADNLDAFALCNCDLNDNVNRTDSGYIKYKPDLPISAFCAGDTGSFILSLLAYLITSYKRLAA